jgi:hypothetical protein
VKKSVFEPFRFGQSKNSKRTYFPAVKVKAVATTPTPVNFQSKRADQTPTKK